MAGWSHEKRVRFEESFYAFLANCWIESKNLGLCSLGDNLYEGQKRFITAVLDGLEQDKHDIYCLKSRQLGISTIARAWSVFYLGINKGLRGALVFDSSSNKENARVELESMITHLPAKLKFPGIKTTNREGLTLLNGSRILFKSAGTKKNASTGSLGRSVGLSMAHLSEICNFIDLEGIISFRRALSDSNPDRLYLYESTARGYNLWKKMWEAARDDEAHCVNVFIGWWGHDKQQIERGTTDWALYGEQPPTPKEFEKIKAVKQLYDYDISQEQLAWYRKLIDPTAKKEGEDSFDEANSYKLQEDPWTEDEAFQQAGSIFFAPDKLTEITNSYASKNFNAYTFFAGQEFFDMRVIKAPNSRMVDLKVWEEPDPDGVYVLGCDPAYGENELNDRSAIQVCRCYADGIDQVAEYASPLITTRQLAWVIASLLGWYGSDNAQIRYALEINGPGTAVFNELRGLRHQLETGYQAKEIEERGLKDIFRNVRTYIYSRPDSMAPGFNWHIKTSQALKITLMERMRDFMSSNKFRIRSFALLDEMREVARIGDSIKASDSDKDDRVLAAAFAVHCWESGPLRDLISTRTTREAEAAKKRLTIGDQVKLFNDNLFQHFFEQKRKVRVAEHQVALRQQWRYR